MRPHWHDNIFNSIIWSLDALLYSWMSTLFCARTAFCTNTTIGATYFLTEPDSDGHVLTVRQELIWPR